MTATSDTIGESQPPGDQSRESQLEAVKDNPPRAPTAQRPTSFTLNNRAGGVRLRRSILPMQISGFARARSAAGKVAKDESMAIELSPPWHSLAAIGREHESIHRRRSGVHCCALREAVATRIPRRAGTRRTVEPAGHSCCLAVEERAWERQAEPIRIVLASQQSHAERTLRHQRVSVNVLFRVMVVPPVVVKLALAVILALFVPCSRRLPARVSRIFTW